MIVSLLLLFVMVLSVSASFAATDDIAVDNADDEIILEEDVLSVQDDTDTLSVDEEQSPVEAADASEVIQASNVVTNETFHNYFDESGSLLGTVTDEELVFEGDFTQVDVNYLIVTKSIKLTGNGAVFKNVDFIISADNVTIDGFSITTTSTQAVYAEGVNNVVISNNIINFTAVENSDAYAIYANSVNNLQIINNNITWK